MNHIQHLLVKHSIQHFIYTTLIDKVTTLYYVCMQSVTQNNLIWIEKNFHIINAIYSEVLIAKYGGSRINEAHTVCPADFVGLPAKVIWPTTFFLKKESDFLLLLCQSLVGWCGSQHMDSHI